MPERRILWTVADPRGLSISLTEDVWQLHVAKHPEIESYFERVQAALREPDEIYFDPESTAERTPGTKVYHYLKRNIVLGAKRQRPLTIVVKVIVEPDITRGYVSSILFPSKMKKGLILEWKR